MTEAAKRGWTPISANFLLPEWVASHWPRYVEGREAVGAKADPADWRVAKCIFVADDEATAQRYGKSPDGPYHFYFKQLMRKLVTAGGRARTSSSSTRRARSAITPEHVTDQLVLAGTVDSVVEQTARVPPRRSGDFGTLALRLPGLDGRGARPKRSMQLMAEQVMPKVNAALAAGAR